MVPAHKQREHEENVLARCFQNEKVPPEALAALRKYRRTCERIGIQRIDTFAIVAIAQPFLPDAAPEPPKTVAPVRPSKPDKPVVVKGALDGKAPLTATA